MTTLCSAENFTCGNYRRTGYFYFHFLHDLPTHMLAWNLYIGSLPSASEVFLRHYSQQFQLLYVLNMYSIGHLRL